MKNIFCFENKKPPYCRLQHSGIDFVLFVVFLVDILLEAVVYLFFSVTCQKFVPFVKRCHSFGSRFGNRALDSAVCRNIIGAVKIKSPYNAGRAEKSLCKKVCLLLGLRLTLNFGSADILGIFKLVTEKNVT